MTAKKKITISFIILLIFSGFNLSAQNVYPEKWKDVEIKINEGLPKSALKIVDEIYSDAKAEKNYPEIIKTLLYRFKLISGFQENYFEKSINKINNELITAEAPEKQILHSIVAETYWKYYLANRYKLLDRTAVADYDEKDINTWPAQKLFDIINKNYLLSLENPVSLKSVDLKSFDNILIQKTDSKKFRPTLYDFLAHRTVNFFSNTESSILKPAINFYLDNENYFKENTDFVKYNIPEKKVFSNKYYAIKILQDLIKFHLNDENPCALVDVDLKRLFFVKQNSIIQNSDSLYLNALINLKNKYENYPSSADVSYEIAKEYYNKGQLYRPLNTDSYHEEKYKEGFKKAEKYCRKAIEDFPESTGATNCKLLLKNIKKKELKLTLNSVNTPNKPFLSLISYKNVSDIYLRLIKISPEKDMVLRQKLNNQELIKEYLNIPVLRTWSEKLPDDNDFQAHKAEIKIPELKSAYYILLLSDDENFDVSKSVIAYNRFFVSNISYISNNAENGSIEFYVLDRIKGYPLKNVKIETFYKEYNYKNRSNEFKAWNNFNTDKKGYFRIPQLPAKTNSKSFYVKFINDSDTLISDNFFYQYPYIERKQKTQTKTFFFTDRAIYRPGQTIYFKGIILEKDGSKYQIKTKEKTSVIFYDVNGKEISKLNLLTNDYGSFNGSFISPSGSLNGRMRISNKTGNISISVEEYKRPNFQISFDKIDSLFKLNSLVSIKGKALSFTGNSVSNAKVKFNVVRKARFPRNFGYFIDYYNQPETMIASGETITDINGNFIINFKAIPDFYIDKKTNPVFDFLISADVTDINGETHSAQNIVSIGYKALKFDIDIPEFLDNKTKEDFKIITRNFSDKFIPAKGEISIYKLKENTKIFRKRLWQRPDKFLMSKEEFYNFFPLDVYDNEDNVKSFEKEKQVFDYNFDTEKDTLFKIENLANFQQGNYLLTAKTKDVFGEDIEIKKYFRIYSLADKKMPDNSTNWFNVLKSSGEPGEKVSFVFGSKYKKANVLYEVYLKDSVISRKWIKISNEKKLIEIPVKEQYRGNIAFSVCFIKNNRVYKNYSIINVPFTDKKLDVKVETFRKEMFPGTKQEWKITVKDKLKGQNSAAEILCSMYDASLDEFVKNKWNFDLYKPNYIPDKWKTKYSFKINSSRQYYHRNYNFIRPVIRDYDRLNWFGFDNFGYPTYKNIDMREKGLGSGNIRASAKGEPLGDELITAETQSLQQEEKIISNEKPEFKLRRNFNETAFFYPDLSTDKNGEIILKFTAPESLTKWRLLALAHTKDLKTGFIEKTVVTAKKLMVIPNAPRFFRENDTCFFSAKIINSSNRDINVKTYINFFDAINSSPVDSVLGNFNYSKIIKIKKSESKSVKWKIHIPEGLQAIKYKIYAVADNFSDGEEKTIPVLTNKIFITESLPLFVNDDKTKKINFKDLINNKPEDKKTNHKLTLEFTTNPAWYAIQALPYLMETPYDCSERIFSRYYANSIASKILNSNPKIKEVFENWKTLSPNALLSNLEKNQELKNIILQETPWVKDAENETESKQRLALLFDSNNISNQLNTTLSKLRQLQVSNGAWPWFKGMRDSRFITQYIVTGFAKLNKLGIIDINKNPDIKTMISKAVKYLDDRICDDYKNIKKYHKENLDKNNISSLQIQYLYARSFLKDFKIVKNNKEAFDYFSGQAKKFWVKKTIYQQAMIAIALNRYGNNIVPQKIISSLKERALYSDEMGMYWRTKNINYRFQTSSVETQAILIEAFNEIAKDNISVEKMKTWLLKQKQTQNWKTTKATVEACYALLENNTKLISNDCSVKISLGNINIDTKKSKDLNIESGTGYFKTSWNKNEICPQMGKISVKKSNKGTAWGAVYWQYFQDADLVKHHKSPLSVNKKIYLKKYTDKGPVLQSINDNSTINTGDNIVVRIKIIVDRDMEYVHLKDMRASAFEPVNVLSGYKYKQGLGYYQNTTDAATNFFFNYLKKGTYIFEYSLKASQKGNYSNGITTIQCMYAPEFTSHSKGIRIQVK